MTRGGKKREGKKRGIRKEKRKECGMERNRGRGSGGEKRVNGRDYGKGIREKGENKRSRRKERGSRVMGFNSRDGGKA